MNEQQRAELEAASIRLLDMASRMAAMEVLITGLETTIAEKVVLLNTLPGAQTLKGEYHFGDDLETDPSKAARVIIGPSSKLEIRSLPKTNFDAVPKAYVDNIVSPLSAQLAKAYSQSLAKPATFATWSKNGAATNLNLTTANVLHQSDNAPTIFAIHDNYIEFLADGTYVISWHVASNTLTSSLKCTLLYNGIAQTEMFISNGSSDTITLTLRASKNTVLSWTGVNAVFTTLSHLLTIAKIGD